MFEFLIPVEIQARVARGADFMDQKFPGWNEKIDLGWLDMQHPNRCVVGQVFGAYSQSMIVGIGLGSNGAYPSEKSAQFGLTSSHIYEDPDVEFSLLTKAWKAEIRARKPAFFTRVRNRLVK